MTGSGFDDFILALRRYRQIVSWVLVASIALPTAAYQVDLTPPWPRGIIIITGLVQIVVMVVTFQTMQVSGRRAVGRILRRTAVLLLVFSALYIVALSQLTFVGGPAKERLVKGLKCTESALTLPAYAADCPLLTDKLIATAEADDELWTRSSITASRVILVLLWLSSFMCFASILVSFVTFQSTTASRFIKPPNTEK